MADVTIPIVAGAIGITGYAPGVIATTAPGNLALIPTILNFAQLQAQLNAILSAIYASMAGFGTVLPAVDGQVEGRLFVDTTGPTLYQMQNGAWVAI